MVEMRHSACVSLWGTARDGGETKPWTGTHRLEGTTVSCGKAEGLAVAPVTGCLNEGIRDTASLRRCHHTQAGGGSA